MNDAVLHELIEACKRGEAKAQKRLYDRFSSKMFALCLRYAASEEEARDILQEGFIRMFRKIGDFRGEGSFEGWLRRIMVSCSIEQYRRNSNQNMFDSIDESISDRLSDRLTVLDNIQARELLKLIEQLSPGYRAVLNMHIIEGYSHKEIASMLGITEGTSKSQLARARNILRQMIAGREDLYYASTSGQGI